MPEIVPSRATHSSAAEVSKGEQSAFPMARIVAVAECGTHAIFAERVEAYTQSEATLAQALLAEALDPGMLLIADRGPSPTRCGER